jgi:hypothetical protein
MRPVEVLLRILTAESLTPAQAMAGMNMLAAGVRGLVAVAGGGAPPTA